MNRKSSLISIFSFLLLLSGNLSPINSSGINVTDDTEGSNTLDTSFLDQIPENDYIIGPGDSFEVIVSRSYSELDSLVSVDGEGTIYLPKLNRVYVQGLNIKELISLLNEISDFSNHQ